MGWDINIIGKHGLRVDDIKHTAEDLSQILQANIKYGHETHDEFIEYGEIKLYSNAPLYVLSEYSDTNACAINNRNLIRLSLEPADSADDRCEIFYLSIYQEAFDLSFKNDFFARWSGFYSHFREDGNTGTSCGLKEYRTLSKKYVKAFNCDKIYHIADQGPHQYIEDKLDSPWNEVLNYINTKQYEKDFYKQHEEEFGRNYSEDDQGEESVVFDVASFMKADHPKYSLSLYDVFVDDFSDLE